MGILWCGGEEIDFDANPPSKSPYGTFRTGYAREAIRTSGANPARSYAFPGGAVTSAWITARIYIDGNLAANQRILGLCNTGETNGTGIWLGSGSAALKAAIHTQEGTSGTKVAEEAGTSITLNALNQFVMHVTNYGVSATVDVYVNGASSPTVTYTGDIRRGTMTNMDSVGIWSPGAGGSYGAYHSEIIVADTDPTTFSLVTLYPNGAGDLNDWTGAYTDIDEDTLSDADLVYTNADAKDAQFALSNVPAGTFAVDAIKIVARACAPGGSTANTLKLGVKSNGSVDVDAGHSLTSSWVSHERIASTINGAQLTTALLDALQLNLRSAVV